MLLPLAQQDLVAASIKLVGEKQKIRSVAVSEARRVSNRYPRVREPYFVRITIINTAGFLWNAEVIKANNDDFS